MKKIFKILLFTALCFLLLESVSFAEMVKYDSTSLQIDSSEATDTAGNYLMYLSIPHYPKAKLSLIEEAINYFHSISLILKTLVIMTIFFLFSIISLFTFVLFKRSYERIITNKKAAVKARYSEFLARYLYSDEEYELPDHMLLQMHKKFYREIFMDLLLDLHSNITGEISDKLIGLYNLLNLKRFSIAKVYNRNWHIKVQGFRELAQMSVMDANKEISKYINNKNIILRIESELALVKLQQDYPLHFLETLTYKFTDWGQINMYDTFVFHNIEVPSFKSVLDSNNESVIVFALRMIGLYRQKNAFKDVLILLNHESEVVRENAILALKHLRMPETLEYLREIFEKETYQNKIFILETMIVLHERSNLPFLVNKMYKEDFNIRLESAISLHKIGADGDRVLDDLLVDVDFEMLRIIRHAKDDRIHA